MRGWAADALAEVVDVRDDEDDEDGGFCEDEACHAHNASGWQLPVFGSAMWDDGCFAHWSPPFTCILYS